MADVVEAVENETEVVEVLGWDLRKTKVIRGGETGRIKAETKNILRDEHRKSIHWRSLEVLNRQRSNGSEIQPGDLVAASLWLVGPWLTDLTWDTYKLMTDEVHNGTLTWPR